MKAKCRNRNKIEIDVNMMYSVFAELWKRACQLECLSSNETARSLALTSELKQYGSDISPEEGCDNDTRFLVFLFS